MVELNLDVPGRGPAPERLDRGFLRREAGGQMPARPAASPAVGELGGSEETIGEARPAAQRPLNPLDLDQVDPRTADLPRAHGTSAAASPDDVDEELDASWTPRTKRAIELSPSIRPPAMMKLIASRYCLACS